MNMPLLVVGVIFTVVVLMKVDSNRLDYYYKLKNVLKVIAAVSIFLMIFKIESLISVGCVFVMINVAILYNIINKRMIDLNGNILYKKYTYDIISELSEMIISRSVTIKYGDEELQLVGNVMTNNNNDVIVNIDCNTIERAYCEFNFTVIMELVLFNTGLLYMNTGESMFVMMGSLVSLIAIMSLVRRLLKLKEESSKAVYFDIIIYVAGVVAAMILLLYLARDRNIFWNLLNTKI